VKKLLICTLSGFFVGLILGVFIGNVSATDEMYLRTCVSFGTSLEDCRHLILGNPLIPDPKGSHSNLQRRR
jgi:hypothetical protein